MHVSIIVVEYFTNVESWTIQELLDALQTNPTKKSKIKIPSYQRSLVWRQTQKKLLIDSIKRGLPVGALLLYHEKAEENYNIYHLIDGLQRSTSVKSYVESPTKFYSEEYLETEFVDNISPFLDNTAGLDDVPDQQAIKGMLINWIQSLKGFSESDGFFSFHLAEEVDKSVGNSLSKQALSDLAKALPRHLKNSVMKVIYRTF